MFSWWRLEFPCGTFLLPHQCVCMMCINRLRCICNNALRTWIPFHLQAMWCWPLLWYRMEDNFPVMEKVSPSPVTWTDQQLFSGTAHVFVILSTQFLLQIQLFQCHHFLLILPALLGVVSIQISHPPCKWLHPQYFQGVILLWSVETSKVVTCHQHLEMQVTIVRHFYNT